MFFRGCIFSLLLIAVVLFVVTIAVAILMRLG